MNKIKLCFTLLIASLLTFSAAHGQSSFIKDSLDTYITREMKRWNIPGVAISVVKDGKVVYQKGFGVRELGKPGKVDENTLFMIASNSKAYTATALALLDKEKRLSLDDKVSKYIPDFKLYDSLASREVTIRDVLSHRLGFLTFQGDFLHWDCTVPTKDLIYNLRNIKPIYSFRSRFGYCNMGFVTAGSIIPIVTDTSWADFVKYNIFKPLGMDRTTTRNIDIVNDKNAAHPYGMLLSKLVELPYDSIDNIGPCASLNSCVKDISNWIIMQLDSGRFNGKQVIPFDALLKTRASNTIVSGYPNDPMYPSTHFSTYGLGWFMRDYMGRKIIEHDGGADGFVTTTMFVPEEKFGVTMLTNTDANELMDAVSRQLLDDLFKVPYRNISAYDYAKAKNALNGQDSAILSWKAIAAKKQKPDLELKAYTGMYTNSVYGDITIKEVNGSLAIYFSHHPHVTGKLEPMGANTFLCTYDPISWGIKVIPFMVNGGTVQSVTISINSFIDYLPYTFNKLN